jgi:hypothetical protein
VDAPPVSYALNLAFALEDGLDLDAIRGVLTAIAPILSEDGAGPMETSSPDVHPDSSRIVARLER